MACWGTVGRPERAIFGGRPWPLVRHRPTRTAQPWPCLPPHPPAARESGHISGLLSLLNAKTGEVQRARPRCLLKGQSAVVEVTPARPLCVEEYAEYRALGRVALRDGGRTVAVGIISGLPGGEPS